MRKKGSKNIRVRLGNKSASKTDNVGSTPATFAYKLTVKSLGRIFKSEGSTLEEALRKIKISGGARAMCVLTVQKGEQTKERIINGNYAQKLFTDVGPTMKDFALRTLIGLIGL